MYRLGLRGALHRGDTVRPAPWRAGVRMMPRKGRASSHQPPHTAGCLAVGQYLVVVAEPQRPFRIASAPQEGRASGFDFCLTTRIISSATSTRVSSSGSDAAGSVPSSVHTGMIIPLRRPVRHGLGRWRQQIHTDIPLHEHAQLTDVIGLRV